MSSLESVGTRTYERESTARPSSTAITMMKKKPKVSERKTFHVSSRVSVACLFGTPYSLHSQHRFLALVVPFARFLYYGTGASSRHDRFSWFAARIFHRRRRLRGSETACSLCSSKYGPRLALSQPIVGVHQKFLSPYQIYISPDKTLEKNSFVSPDRHLYAIVLKRL